MNEEAEKNLIPFPKSEALSVLTHFDRARQELELASTIDEVKSIRDKAEALRLYARQARLCLDMQNRCAEIKIRAERRAGEMLQGKSRGLSYSGPYLPKFLNYLTNNLPKKFSASFAAAAAANIFQNRSTGSSFLSLADIAAD